MDKEAKEAIEKRIAELEQVRQQAVGQSQVFSAAAKEQEARALRIDGGIAELRLLLQPAETSK